MCWRRRRRAQRRCGYWKWGNTVNAAVVFAKDGEKNRVDTYPEDGAEAAFLSCILIWDLAETEAIRCAKPCFNEIGHTLEGGEDTCDGFWVKAKAAVAKGNNRLDHLVVVSLGVNAGDSGREAELPDDIKGEPFNDDERGTVTSLHDVLFGENSVEVLCLTLEGGRREFGGLCSCHLLGE